MATTPPPIKARADWYEARDEARRADRNLLQYAGAMAAVIGIGSGSGGILAIANALDDSTGALIPEWVFFAILAAATATVILLVVPLVATLRLRGDAEDLMRTRLRPALQEDPTFDPAWD